MKKRNGGSGRRQGSLPMTEADRSDQSGKRRKKRRHLSPLQASFALFAAILSLGMLIAISQRYFLGSSVPVDIMEEPSRKLVAKERDLPLQDFPSLQYALRNSEIALLYFAASWCPMSTPVTERIDEIFRDVLMEPPDEDSPRNLLQRHGVSLVYVSSDRDEAEMEQYLKPNWMTVPFHSEERAALKRRFATCARRELQTLGMERKHEIPTLIVLSGPTHQVLTFHGVKDVEEYGINAIDHWIELEHLSAALDEKFVE